MDVYFLRHGQALAGLLGQDDAERELSPEGANDIKYLGQVLEKRGLKFDAILTSPFKRAYRTAQIIEEALSQKPKIEILNDLASGKPGIEEILGLLKERDSIKSVLIVGHMPELGEIVGCLLKTSSHKFKAGALCGMTLTKPFGMEKAAKILLSLDPPTYDQVSN